MLSVGYVVERYNHYLTRLFPGKRPLCPDRDRRLVAAFREFAANRRMGATGYDDYLDTAFSRCLRRVRSPTDKMSAGRVSHAMLLGGPARAYYLEAGDRTFRKDRNHLAARVARVTAVETAVVDEAGLRANPHWEEASRRSAQLSATPLPYCVEFAPTLHHPDSVTCMSCPCKMACRAVQRERLPGIFAARNRPHA